MSAAACFFCQVELYSVVVSETALETSLGQLDDAMRWNLLQARMSEGKARAAFELLRAHDIEPILIKGIAAGQWYPPLEPRVSLDTDLAVSSGDYQLATEIVASDAADGLAIDLHCELRHLDTLSWDDLVARSTLNPEGLRFLSPEDHLRVICIHWLTDGARDRSRLWDIYHAIDKRPQDFDWDRFINSVSSRRQRWLSCAVGMAERYLGLELRGTPLAGAGADIPRWFTQTAEAEWASERIRPLDTVLHDRAALFRQLMRRMRPNPIWATVQMEGSFDARTRVFYRLGSFFTRAMPGYRRIVNRIRAQRG